MRSVSRRPFTVEAKASRRHTAVIPTRVATPVTARPRTDRVPPPAPEAAEEKRRILPSLIAPEPHWAEAETPQPEEAAPRRRGRPRKPRPPAPEPAAPPAQAVPAPVRQEREAPQEPPARARPLRVARSNPAAVPAPGERWKRRLGRWSR